MKNNPGKVQVGVQFCNGKIILPNAHAHNIDEKAYIADCQHMHLKSTFVKLKIFYFFQFFRINFNKNLNYLIEF